MNMNKGRGSGKELMRTIVVNDTESHLTALEDENLSLVMLADQLILLLRSRLRLLHAMAAEKTHRKHERRGANLSKVELGVAEASGALRAAASTRHLQEISIGRAVRNSLMATTRGNLFTSTRNQFEASLAAALTAQMKGSEALETATSNLHSLQADRMDRRTHCISLAVEVANKLKMLRAQQDDDSAEDQTECLQVLSKKLSNLNKLRTILTTIATYNVSVDCDWLLDLIVKWQQKPRSLQEYLEQC